MEFSGDQEQFRQMLRRFCDDKAPTSAVRSWMASDLGYDQALWQQLCQELGIAGIHLPEQLGGSGFGAVELGIVMEELGRSLLCAPMLGSAVLASSAIACYATETEAQTLLAPLISGEETAALAWAEADGDFLDPQPSTTIARTTDGVTVTGQKRFVVDAQRSNWVVVLANDEGDLRLCQVMANASGVQYEARSTLDTTRRLGEMTFTAAPARLLGSGPVDVTALVDLSSTALANEMVGGAQALLDATVAYVKLRVQFGRTIGSFQAIKHRLADLLLLVESARSAAYRAAIAIADNHRATELASLAKAAASDAYLQTAVEAIQLHGGIGFTWENDTQLWFKRAKSSEVFLGTPNQHRERMLQAMGV